MPAPPSRTPPTPSSQPPQRPHTSRVAWRMFTPNRVALPFECTRRLSGAAPSRPDADLGCTGTCVDRSWLRLRQRRHGTSPLATASCRWTAHDGGLPHLHQPRRDLSRRRAPTHPSPASPAPRTRATGLPLLSSACFTSLCPSGCCLSTASGTGAAECPRSTLDIGTTTLVRPSSRVSP